jgi:hypothetical protein
LRATPVKRSATALIAVAALAALIALLAWQRQRSTHAAGARVAVRGGDGGGLPIAAPADEHFDAAALEAAARDPAAAGLAAFIVMRHGHVVLERFGHGYGADTMIDSGPLARVLVALAAGIAAQDGTLADAALSGFNPAALREAIQSGTHQGYADYLGERLWSRLNAAPAWIAVPAAGAVVPADCCFHARVIDWMRVGGLLVDGGSFEDTQVVGTEWVTRMRRPLGPHSVEGFGIELAPSASAVPATSGAPAMRALAAARGFEVPDMFFVRGAGHWRLWLAPSLRLVVLFGAAGGRLAGADAPPWDETRLPNLVIGALTERGPPAPGQPSLQQLVPGH